MGCKLKSWTNCIQDGMTTVKINPRDIKNRTDFLSSLGALASKIGLLENFPNIRTKTLKSRGKTRRPSSNPWMKENSCQYLFSVTDRNYLITEQLYLNNDAYLTSTNFKTIGSHVQWKIFVDLSKKFILENQLKLINQYHEYLHLQSTTSK